MPHHRILLVDDSPLDVELTLLALGDQGLNSTVHVALGGQEALDYLGGLRATELPELLLLDLKMPGVDGLAVLTQVRARPAWAALRIVILTTSAEPHDREASLRGGADAFVQKSPTLPAYLQAMREITRVWLGGPGVADPGAVSVAG